MTTTVPQGEQGDAMMPLLFSLGQHGALQAAHRNLREGEFLFACHDDVVMVTAPDDVVASRRDQDPCWHVEQGRRVPPDLRRLGETLTQVPGFGEGQECLQQNKEAVSEQGFREAPDPVPAHSFVVGRAVSMASLVHGAGARANHTLRCILA